MRVRFIRSWKNYRDGQELEEFHDGMANMLIRRGILICIEDEKPNKKRRKEYMVPPEARHA